ncbi:hypothetical protein MRX96_011487 [Rhipicephalus microplus]
MAFVGSDCATRGWNSAPEFLLAGRIDPFARRGPSISNRSCPRDVPLGYTMDGKEERKRRCYCWRQNCHDQTPLFLLVTRRAQDYVDGNCDNRYAERGDVGNPSPGVV